MIKLLFLILLTVTSNVALAKPGDADPEQLTQAFDKAAKKVGVPVRLLRAICWAESDHDPISYEYNDGNSGNSAFGICQVLQRTAEDFGIKDARCSADFTLESTRTYKNCKLFGLYTNILIAARYLKSKLDKYDGSWSSAIAAYNTGTIRICRKGKVYRAKDRSILYTCKKGHLLNQKYVDRVLHAIHDGR